MITTATIAPPLALLASTASDAYPVQASAGIGPATIQLGDPVFLRVTVQKLGQDAVDIPASSPAPLGEAGAAS